MRLERTTPTLARSYSTTELQPQNWNTGAGDPDRTGDIELGRIALYQLSYTRKHFEPTMGVEPATVCLQNRCSTIELRRH